MQYTIRPALCQDLPAIVDIYNSTVTTRQSTADLSPTTVAEREMWFAAHTDKRPIYALYDADGTVLAWGSFSDYHPRYAYHISAEVSIYVRHDMRRSQHLCPPRYARCRRGQNPVAAHARTRAVLRHPQRHRACVRPQLSEPEPVSPFRF